MRSKLALILLICNIIACISCHSKSGQRIRNQNINNPPVADNNSFITGKVIGIIDGDTYDLLLEGNVPIRIRMEGIDAPEKGMPYYKVSKNYLAQLCFNKIIKLKQTGKDGDRIIGFSYLVDGTEIGHEMIKAGLAWHAKKYNSDEDLAKLEIEARNARRGLWSQDNPMSPLRNKQLHKQGISTKDSFKLEEVEKAVIK